MYLYHNFELGRVLLDGGKRTFIVIESNPH